MSNEDGCIRSVDQPLARAHLPVPDRIHCAGRQLVLLRAVLIIISLSHLHQSSAHHAHERTLVLLAALRALSALITLVHQLDSLLVLRLTPRLFHHLSMTQHIQRPRVVRQRLQEWLIDLCGVEHEGLVYFVLVHVGEAIRGIERLEGS